MCINGDGNEQRYWYFRRPIYICTFIKCVSLYPHAATIYLSVMFNWNYTSRSTHTCMYAYISVHAQYFPHATLIALEDKWYVEMKTFPIYSQRLAHIMGTQGPRTHEIHPGSLPNSYFAPGFFLHWKPCQFPLRFSSEQQSAFLNHH